MTKSIKTIYIFIVIYKILIASVIWGIYINKINSSCMCFLEQLQALQIISFKNKIVGSVCRCGYFLIGIFREDGNILFEHFVHSL